MKITITRSDEYVRTQRIATGQNVPSAIKVDIDPALLAETTRQAIIGWWNEYPAEIERIGYNPAVTEISTRYRGWGSFGLAANVEPQDVTPVLIDSLIVQAQAQIADLRREYQASQVELAKRNASEAKERAELLAQQTAAIDIYLIDPHARPSEIDTCPRYWVSLAGLRINRDHPRWNDVLTETEARLLIDERAKHAERDAWIAEHGSDRLRRLLAEGIECEHTYLDERVIMERPGWAYDENRRGEANTVRNARQEGLDLLDEARKVEPTARLVWWKIEHEHVDGCDQSCPDECSKHDWKGYACTAEFLGKDIVYGVPDEFVC